MLYIDPRTCIDCGARVEACPVEAIYAEDDLPTNLTAFAVINASYFDLHPLSDDVLPMVELRSSAIRCACISMSKSAAIFRTRN